jgi:uncharacterized protein involved in outer membrane biogenesis
VHAGRRAPASRLARPALGVAAGLVAAAVLAAWAIPPMLDWGRFRTGIAAIAASRLGRPVTIGGEVTLRLLPEAVLTATDVTLPDQGDGVSASIGALRLQVAVLPLLARRIVPRDLVLSTPVLRLPWPPPETLAHPARPRVPQAFAAHLENGTLRIGQARVTGINAGLHGGPEPATGAGLLSPDGTAQATPGFGAEGFADFGGRTWRFTSALGAPDADGVSAVDLAVGGQGAAGQTGGTVQGTLADGVVQGRLVAGGPDLSLLMPAARLAWHADAPFVASGARIEARSLSLSLGGAPADGALLVRLGPAARLDARLHAAAFDLDGWLRVLAAAPGVAGIPWPSLPGRLDLAADTVGLAGGTLRGAHGALVSDGASLRLEGAGATLPGEAELAASGAVAAGPAGLRITGPARLRAPLLPRTLAWLHAFLPALPASLPPGLLLRADLAGTATLGRDGLSLAGLAGQVDGTGIAGSLGLGFSIRPRIAARLTLDGPALDDWFGPGGPGANLTLAAAGAEAWAEAWAATWAEAGRNAAAIDADIHLAAPRAAWRGLALRDLALDLRSDAGGLVVDRAAASLPGVSLAGSLALRPDGAVTRAAVSGAAPDLAAVAAWLPAAWRLAPGLWHGAGSWAASVSGPPDAMVAAARADAGDLVLEAEGTGNPAAGTGEGTLTLRHPGAPRLLAVLGMGGAETWLGTGSLALRAHVAVTPDRVLADGFDLQAADLRLGGQLSLGLSGPQPFLAGRVDAEMLALPPLPALALAAPGWPRGWGAALSLRAAHLTLGGRKVAARVAAELGLGGGDGLLDVASADIAGGRLAGQFAFDGGRSPPALALRASLSDAHLDGAAGFLPVDLTAGVLAGSADLEASGADAASLRHSLAGQVTATLREARLTGFDMRAASGALSLAGRAARPALLAALSGGATDGLSGWATLAIGNGALSLAHAQLSSDAGVVTAQGTADLSGGLVDLAFAIAPAGTPPAGTPTPGLGVRVTGPWATAHAVPLLPAAPAHPRKPKRR